MGIIDKIQVGSTTYDMRDSDTRSIVENIFNDTEVHAITPAETRVSKCVYVSTSSGTNKLAFTGWNNGNCYTVDVDECGELLTFGFDKTETIPSQSIVMAYSATMASGDPILGYNNQNTIINGHQNLGPRGIDNSHIDDGYVTVTLSKLKDTFPTIKYITINIASGASLPTATTHKPIVKANFLRAGGAVPAHIVAADGSGDYTTISDAVAAAVNGDTIFIRTGEYKESVVVKKYVHLVGESKQGTILYNDVGDYDHAPLCITQGSVRNMTIKSLAPADTSGLTDYAYGIHLDKNFASAAKYQKCEIANCDIYSEVNDGIGAGTNYATDYDIHDCVIQVAHNPVKANSCGFKCHNGQGQTGGSVRLRNNIIMTADANGTTRYDILFHNGGISNTQAIELLQVGNVLKYYHNTITDIFVPTAYNYGNSVAEMNTLS